MADDLASTAPPPTSPGERGILRFITCGSVDDGKSTLIGRLLVDSAQVLDDQLSALERDSRRHGTTGEDMDLALLLDGLEAEREQGITIDVAYRYFATPARTFVVADTPGHEQYTRNMATGASNAELAVLLVDARKGVLQQTKRHAAICALMGIRHIVLAINKMDLVGWSEDVFARIVATFATVTAPLGALSVVPVPIAARWGDNVARRSGNMPWYTGPTLLGHLETVAVEEVGQRAPFRFAVQWVNRPHLDFRGYAGTIASGRIAVGDGVVAAVSGRSSRIVEIIAGDGPVPEAAAGDAVTLRLADEIDITRGDLLVGPEDRPDVADQFAAHVIWMGEEPLLPGRSYLIRIGTRWTPATITGIRHKIDPNTLQQLPSRKLDLNEIAVCHIATTGAVAFDSYAANRATGGFILVDRFSNQTVAAGMIDFALRRATNIHPEDLAVDKAARAALKWQRPTVLWFTGLSGSGKSTVAKRVESLLHARGAHTYMLDGDNLRHGLNRDLGFTDADRVENIRRVGEVAKLFVDAGLIVLCSFISPFRAERRMVRDLLEPGEFIEIFVDAPIEECIRRDPRDSTPRPRRG
jgi:bifunctional enzyme CysN/CysC